MDTVIDILLRTYSVLLPILLGYIIKLLQEDRKEKRANAEGIKCLLRIQLIEYHDKYTELGYIPTFEKDNWNDMFQAYTSLHGNGTIEQYNEDIIKLKSTRERKAR